MTKKRITISVFCILILGIILTASLRKVILGNATLSIKTASATNDEMQLFFSEDLSFSETRSVFKKDFKINLTNTTEVAIPLNSQYIRLDFSNKNSEIVISSFDVTKLISNVNLLELMRDTPLRNNCEIVDNGSSFTVITTSDDPYIIFDTQGLIVNDMKSTLTIFWLVISAFMTLTIFIILFFTIIKNTKNNGFSLMKELKNNRKLIWSLSKNDFKTKYAGSYFGIFWAFVQPIVTIMIYVFVFQIGFKAAPEGDYPYVLWLIAGIIPWFFFVESLVNATNCLLEYSYLVKKVVFKVSVLPIVKIISSLFVHLFFILFAILIYIMNGKVPDIAILQVIYYCICIDALVLSISYMTSSIVPFFKDFSQIVSILTQIGMWMLPIMWNKNMLAAQFQWILKLNPMYYVVEGYRDSFIYGNWFWQKPAQTIYFWGCVILIYLISKTIFKKLKVHFSDVL